MTRLVFNPHTAYSDVGGTMVEIMSMIAVQEEPLWVFYALYIYDGGDYVNDGNKEIRERHMIGSRSYVLLLQCDVHNIHDCFTGAAQHYLLCVHYTRVGV